LIFDAQIETRDMGDARVLAYLRENAFTNCIDIGGVQRPWAAKHVSTYVDLVRPEQWGNRYPGMYDACPEIWDAQIINRDCEKDETWDVLISIVGDYGKFDFAISAHMLEHLCDPAKFLERLPLIADQGYIGVPNKIFELGRGREFSDDGMARCGLNGSYRGAFPHKWIIDIKDGVVWLFPKLGALEYVDFRWEDKLHHYEPLDYGQLSFFWRDEIPFRMVTDKDIGFPDPQIGVEFYRNNLEGGLL